MKATFVKMNKDGINRNHRKENHFDSEIQVMAIERGEICKKISCRMYHTAAMSYCCIWISGNGGMLSGSGSAGGYGYHRASAAVGKAIENAGFQLSERIGGVGNSAIESALLAIAKTLKFKKPVLITAHA